MTQDVVLICDPRCGLSWRMFHVHLRRNCILLLLDAVSYNYQLNLSGLMWHLSCVSLLIFCLDALSISVSGVLKSPTITVLLSIFPFMAVSLWLCIEMLLYWMHKYLQFLCLLGWIP